jgi:hypothetical protein
VYPPHHFAPLGDKLQAVNNKLILFQKNLAANDIMIDKRNQMEEANWSANLCGPFVKYNTLLQPNIPQSTNI